MATQTQLQYREVLGTDIEFSRTKALDEGGNPILGSRYDAGLWVQERGLFLPSSITWSEGRAYFEKLDPEMERGMITGVPEYVDDIIAWTNPEDGKYASNINPTPKQGKYPIRILGSVIDKKKDGTPVIDGGEKLELPYLPRQSGKLERDIPELGLIRGAYMWNDSDFKYEQGLRAVFRGLWYLGPRVRRFDAVALRRPSVSDWGVGFRPVRRGLVRIGRQDYTKVIKILSSTEGTPESRLDLVREILSKYQ